MGIFDEDLALHPWKETRAPAAQPESSPMEASGPIWEPRNGSAGTSPTRIAAYVQGAVNRELSWLLGRVPGERNPSLNISAFRLGQFVGAGLLDRTGVEDQLRAAALAIGLGLGETEATIASGLGAGVLKPREISLGPDRVRIIDPGPAQPAGEPEPDPLEPVLDDALGSSWLPLDLAETVAGLLDGTLTRAQPTIGRLPNGEALFYAGRVNGLHGDSTSGKTWTALATCREQLGDGERVLYVDLEDNEAGIVGRLLDMGVDPGLIVKGFAYVRPYDPCDAIALGLLLATVEQIRPSLVVVDTTGEALALQGLNPNADEEVATWMRRIARRIADLGPAVVLLDHIPKSSDGTTPLQPIGSQRKRAAISGAQYAQDCREPFSQDENGYARLRCGKDRGGNYATGRHLADLRIGPDVIGVAQLETPSRAEGGTFRPTALMRRVSDYLSSQPGSSQNAIVRGVEGKTTGIRSALHVLIAEGFVTVQPGPNRTLAHTLARPYFGEPEGG